MSEKLRPTYSRGIWSQTAATSSITWPSPSMIRRLLDDRSMITPVLHFLGTEFVYQVLSRARHAEKHTPSIHVEAIELGGVVAQNPTLVLLADALEVMRDFFSRVGPERRAVGKVR